MLAVVASCAPGLVDGRVDPDAHLLTSPQGQKMLEKIWSARLWISEEREVLGHSGSPRFRLALAFFCFAKARVVTLTLLGPEGVGIGGGG